MTVTSTPRTRRRRSDAERSIAAIVLAAVDLLSRRPEASMTEIAEAAGVGRVTLYAHFPSREPLVEAAIRQALTHASAALDAADMDDGSPSRALGRMVRTSWSSIERYRGLMGARGLPASRLRQHHAGILDRIDELIARGQAAGEFRTDLPRGWLVSLCLGLFHTAAEEVEAGRLDADQATAVLEATLLGVLEPRGAR